MMMLFHGLPSRSETSAASVDRRAHRRIKNRRQLQSPLGEVVDFSEGGIQVFHKGRAQLTVGQAVELTLRQGGESLTAAATVAWIKPMGFRRRTIGLAFQDLSTEAEAQLRALVGTAHDEFAGPAAYFNAS